MKRFFLWSLTLFLFVFGAGVCSGAAGGGIRLDKAAFMIDSGDKMKIRLAEAPAGGVQWTSSDEKVATVSRSGVVTGVSKGDAVITASAAGSKAECIVSVGYEGQNPILPPTWGLFIADGEPHVFDGRMYIFGSRDVTNGFLPNGERDFCSTDYHVIYSDDLIHWTDAGVSISIDSIPAEIRGNTRRLWAPDVFKSPTEKDKYYLLFCGNGQPVYIAEGTSPTGPFGNVRLVTLNGEPIPQIDPGVLVDDDGKVYLASPKFFICRLDPSDYSRVMPETCRDVTQYMPVGDEPFEGPSLRNRNGIYYYIYIQNKGNIERDGAVPTLMGYMTAENPLGPYTYRGVIVTNYDYPASGNIHGSIEPFDGQWYVSYHMPVSELGLTRAACLDRIEFDDDGTIRRAEPTSSGVKGCFVPGERIRSSSGVVYSGGRNDRRLVTRREPTANPYVFRYVGYPYTFYNELGQWIGYRFMDFSPEISTVGMSVCTEASGGSLEIRRGSADGELIAAVDLPNTDGEWKKVEAPASVTRDGKDAFYIFLKTKPGSGDVRVDWLEFGARR